MKRGSMLHKSQSQSQPQLQLPPKKKIYYYKNTNLNDFIDQPATLEEINKKITSIYSQIEDVGKVCEERLQLSEKEYLHQLEQERIELDIEIEKHLTAMEQLLDEYKQRNNINYANIYKSLSKETLNLQKEYESSTIQIKKYIQQLQSIQEDINFLTNEINYNTNIKNFLQHKIDILTGNPSRNNNNIPIQNLPKVLIPNRFTTNISNIQNISNNNVNNSSINYVESVSSVHIPSAIRRRQLNQSSISQGGGLLITKLNMVNTNPKSSRRTLGKSLSSGRISVANKQEHKMEILEQHFCVLENKYKKMVVTENKNVKKNERKYFQLKTATKNKMYNILKMIIMDDVRNIVQKGEDGVANSRRQSSLGSISTNNASMSFNVNHLTKNEKKDIAIRFFENMEIKKIIYEWLYSS